MSSSHRNALPAGSMLLWYQIERVLGQGAFGVTYLAQDSNLHRPVAIKEYLPSQLSFREDDGSVLAISDELADEYAAGLRRFVTEARTLAKFEHPSIVRVHNVFEANRTAYMVMRYEEGEDLGQVLKRRRTLSEADLLRLLYPLLAGLEVIHAQGFVHRDIKPGNIFIRRDGTPLLLDFGSAREAMGGVSRTLTNFVSPGYAPIEQYASKSDGQGPWSDIYGLGATVYRAMTGRAPIDAVERSNALAQETSDSYQTGAQSVQDWYSAELLSAVDHALSFRAQDRPQSVAEWRRELPPAPPDTAASSGVFAAADHQPSANDAAISAPTLMLTLPGTELKHVEDVAPGLAVPVPAAIADEKRVTNSISSPAPPAPPAPPARSGRMKVYLGALLALIVVALLGGSWLGRALSEREVTVTVPEPAAVAPDDSTAAFSTPMLKETAATTPDASGGLPAAMAVPDAEQERIDRIAELLFTASQDLDALRLTSPTGQNAYEKYREILRLEPDHGPALRGIEAISDQYVGLIYRDLERRNFDRAEIYLRKAETLAPGRPAVIEAREALTAERLAAAKSTVPENAQATAAPAPAGVAETPPASSRMDKFRQRFEDFVREQNAAQRERRASRGDQIRERLGGKR